MGKTANRLSVIGFFVAASAVLLLPGTAAADPADPALDGSCDATLGNNPGQALTLDAGAPVDTAGVITVGTGTTPAPTGPVQSPPLLSLPVADGAKALGVGDLPVAGPALTDIVCPQAQNTVNALSTATQSLGSGRPLDPPPGSTPPASPAPRPPTRPSPAPSTPGAPGTPGGSGTGSHFADYPLNPTPPMSVGILVPVAQGAQASVSAMASPTGTSPAAVSQEAASAQVMSVSSTAPAKLPLLLAAVALALVGAALAHTWLRRAVV